MTITTLAEDIRSRLHERLTQTHGQAKVRLWIDAGTSWELLTDDQHDTAALRVVAPSRFVADRLRRAGMVTALSDAAAELLNHPVQVHVEIAASPAAAPTPSTLAPAQANAQPKNQPTPTTKPFTPQRPPISSGSHARVRTAGHPYATTGLVHHLNDFVTGPCNELAFAAAQRLANANPNDPADKPITAVPLFLHGGCGRGKTHLLQGICRRWLEHHPGARVLYTTGEQFTNRYIDHAKRGELDAFRKEMRSVDLLAIDDVHFIAGKAKTQNEFLHCFDAVELCGAPVVMASDLHPKQIKQFPEALASRCLRGLVLELDAPDTAMRRKLLMAMGAKQQLIFQPAAVDLLASEAGPSVREVEGLLRQLHALATLDPAAKHQSALGVHVGVALVDRLLQHQRRSNPLRPATVPAIANAVALRFGLTPRQILGNGRQRPVVLARSVVAYLAYRLTGKSYPEVAAAMGRPNHSSIITAAKRITQLLDQDTSIQLPTADHPIRVKDLLDDLTHAARSAK